jgi:peptidoglycan/xylan/chitin deacetylase (PgdA/CDA1 family)
LQEFSGPTEGRSSKSHGLTRRSFALGTVALTVGTVAAPASERFIWPGGAKAAVSLTYDDGYDSQLENVAPFLDALGYKATFFLTVENIDERLNDWVALSEKGHEIGDHTMTHPCTLGDYSAGRFMSEQIAPAERYFDVHFSGAKPRCYAYPCGFEDLGDGATVMQANRYQELLRPTFLAARTVGDPPNDPRKVLRQRYSLNGYEPTYELDDPNLALAYVRKAVDLNHWAILIFHEVLDVRKAEGDTSTAVHQKILENLSSQPIWCAPMRTVFSYVTGVT